jgi:hypothetical protein
MAFAYSFISTSEGAESSEEGEDDEGVIGGSGTIEISELEKDTGDTEDTEDTEDAAAAFQVMFETGKCAMESKIQAIATVVEGLAENYITDCTDETVIGDDDDDTDPTTDTDGDCIPDSVEKAGGTDYRSADTDGDALPDGWNAESGLGEDLNCNGVIDKDADGNPYETDPTKSDTDGDGSDDFIEMTCGGVFNLSNLAAALDPTEQCDTGSAE